MPIIDLKGKRIKEEDIGFLKKMIEGSLENHIAHKMFSAGIKDRLYFS